MLSLILSGVLSLVLPEPPPALPEVIVYTAPGCLPCKLALADLRRIARVREVRDCPPWVTQVPTVVWQDRGQWVQHAPKHWRGPTWAGEWPRVRRLIEGQR